MCGTFDEDDVLCSTTAGFLDDSNNDSGILCDPNVLDPVCANDCKVYKNRCAAEC